MGIKYLLFHSLFHLFLIAIIYFVFQLDLLGLVAVFLVSAFIDADHLPFLKRHGLRYWFKISWKTHEPRKYPLHNFLTIVIFSAASFLVLSEKYFFIGILSLSAALHLWFDFLEDVLIFDMGIKHWK